MPHCYSETPVISLTKRPADSIGHTKLITYFSDRPGRNSDLGGEEKINHIKYIYANYSVVTVSDSDGIIKPCFCIFYSPVARWLLTVKSCTHYGTTNIWD